jgi:hypothetical protein
MTIQINIFLKIFSNNSKQKELQYKAVLADILVKATEFTVNQKGIPYFVDWLLVNYRCEPINQKAKIKEKDISNHFNKILSSISGFANKDYLKKVVETVSETSDKKDVLTVDESIDILNEIVSSDIDSEKE